MKISKTIIALALLMMGVGGAKAQEQPGALIYEYDYSTKTSYDFYRMSDVPQVENGVLTVTNPTAGARWDVQYFVGDGVSTQLNGSYIIRFEIKGSAAGSLTCNFGDWTEAQSRTVNFTDEWQTVDILQRGVCSSSFIVFQSGNFAGTLELKKVQVFDTTVYQEVGDKVVENDFSTIETYTFWNEGFSNGSIGIEDNVLKVVNNQSGLGNWQCQYFVADGVPTTQNKDYLMRVTIKGSASGSLDCHMGDWSNTTSRKLIFSNEQQTIDLWFYNVPATSSQILFQSGAFVGTIEIAKVEVYAINEVQVQLKNGWEELTLDMCKSWDGTDESAQPTGSAGEINLNEPRSGGDVVYGGNAPWSVYADVTGSKILIITGTPGFPVRILYNRQKNAEGGDGTYGEFTRDMPASGFMEVNLLPWGKYCHINSIKKGGWGGETSGMVNELLVLGEGAKAEYTTIGETGYSTFSPTADVAIVQAKAYYGKYNSSTNTVKLSAVDVVPAGQGIILNATPGTYAFPEVDAAEGIVDNDLKASDGTVTGDGSTIYALATFDGVTAFYPVDEGVTIPAGKAYLQITGASHAPVIRFGGDDIATGINNIQPAHMQNSAVYNLNGQRVVNPTKGLFIVNGKKVIK